MSTTISIKEVKDLLKKYRNDYEYVSWKLHISIVILYKLMDGANDDPN